MRLAIAVQRRSTLSTAIARRHTSDNTKDLEFLSNLLQTLYSGVLHGHFSQEECQLQARAARLYSRLDDLSTDGERPNNALEARTLRLVGRLNTAMLDQDDERVSALWPEFEQIFADAQGLGEYDPGSLIRIVEGAGSFAGNDPAYNSLVEKMAAFVSDRTSEAQGALVLLNRAKQLDFDDRFDMIRWLGRAVRRLAKREYAPHLIETAQHLALAYRSAGLLWAARATCVFATASIVIEGEEDSDIDVGIVPTLVILGWITLELRHIPDFCNVVRLLHGCLNRLPLDDTSKDRLTRRLQEFDLVLGSTLLNCTAEELGELEGLPDILDALGLFMARTALLYALGYADELRADGSIPPEETDEGAAEMFGRLASQPAADEIRGPLVLNAEGPQSLQTIVAGAQINLVFDGSVVSTLVAEAGMAAIEACFATAFELEIVPHTERFDIQIIEDEETDAPRFVVDQPNSRATLHWPKNRMPTDYDASPSTTRTLTEMAVTTMGATCIALGGKETAKRLVDEDAVFERISVMAVTGNSYHRIFSQYVSRLADFPIQRRYTTRRERPTISRTSTEDGEPGSDEDDQPVRVVEKRTEIRNHREVELRSIINSTLWNKARWKGVLYASYGADLPPVMGLIFGGDADAAKAIFSGWRDRFGEKDRDNGIHIAIVQNVCSDHPAHYNVLVTSKPEPEAPLRPGGVMLLARMHRMEPETDENLRRFLPDYKRFGAYILMPTLWNGGNPKLMPELAIMKYGLVVRSASDIQPSEIEYLALGPDAEARTGT
ncbi:MAG: tetratricopeptide repeat protein [Rhodomicrobium sp.]|nr:tetratricopeptide repeat protein [Rhodomicrobium sp.]